MAAATSQRSPSHHQQQQHVYVQELAFHCSSQNVKIPPEYLHNNVQSRSSSSEGYAKAFSATSAGGSIPVLDFSRYVRSWEESRRTRNDDEHDDDRRMFLSDLREACAEWGFFVVENHGIAPSLLHRVRAVQRRFFDLPLAMKREVENDVAAGSYDGYGSIIGSAAAAAASGSGAAPRDWRDYYYVTFLPFARRRSLAKWPLHPPHFRETIEEYGEQVVSLWKTLMKALGESLGTSRLEEAFGELDMGIGMNYYPPCPQPSMTLGLRSHSDPGGITILLQDEHVPGLQVKTSNDEWVTIQPTPDSLIINIGDQLEILTNGLYKSVEHRVFVNNAFDRISFACFLNPGDDVEVAPLQEILGENDTPKYKAMTFKQYRSFIRQRGLPENKKHQTESKIMDS